MRIGTYNVRVDMPPDWFRGNGWWFKRHPLVIEKIKKANLDIISMQEVKHWLQLWSLDLFLKGYKSHSIGRDSDNGMFGERLGIWWKKEKYDLISKYHFFLSDTPEKSSKGWDGRYKCLCVVVRLQDKLTNEIINVFCTHLDTYGPEAQLNGMNLVLEHMQSVDQSESIYMMGDLNISQGSKSHISACLKYNDAFKMAGEPECQVYNTYTAFKPVTSNVAYRCDMIFTSKMLIKSYFNDYDYVASDHNLVVCEF